MEPIQGVFLGGLLGGAIGALIVYLLLRFRIASALKEAADARQKFDGQSAALKTARDERDRVQRLQAKCVRAMSRLDPEIAAIREREQLALNGVITESIEARFDVIMTFSSRSGIAVGVLERIARASCLLLRVVGFVESPGTEQAITMIQQTPEKNRIDLAPLEALHQAIVLAVMKNGFSLL